MDSDFLSDGAYIRRGPQPFSLSFFAGMALRAQDDNSASAFVCRAAGEAFVRGVQAYHRHPYRRDVSLSSDFSEVWRAGTVSLLLFCAKERAHEKTPAIFLIPSMINRSYIFDLLPDKSFVRWLAAQGKDVYVLDWGMPEYDDGQRDFDTLMKDRLLPALSFAAQHSGAPLHALGYCMGGVFLTALAAQKEAQASLDRLCFLATPWDFRAGDPLLKNQVLASMPLAFQQINRHNVLGAEWLQGVFAMVNADRVAEKFARFSALAPESKEATLFVATEDWLNGGVALPAGLVRTFLLSWYAENRTAKGTWCVGGENIRPEDIDIPSLIVAPSRDRLVPAESAKALASRLSRATLQEPCCGHVGMMTGRRAETDVWYPLLEWLRCSKKN